MKTTTDKIKLGRKAQITIPKEIRTTLGIKEGAELYITIIDTMIVILPRPKSILELGGIAKGLYKKDFIEKLRNEWA